MSYRGVKAFGIVFTLHRSSNYNMADSSSRSESGHSEVDENPSESGESSVASIYEQLCNGTQRISIISDESAEEAEGVLLSRNTGSEVETDTGDESANEDSSGEGTDGQWLSCHPWEKEAPWDLELKMEDTVENSPTYPTASKWTKNGKVDLAKIYSNLSTFVRSEMQGSINGSRQELEQIICKLHQKENPNLQNPSDLAPHTIEIVEEIRGDTGIDKRLEPGDTSLVATSLPLSPMCPAEENYFDYDCEYILQIFVPHHFLSWFDTQQCTEARWIKGIKSEYREKRWIFIPSFRREKIALLHWPEYEAVNGESTIRILVVRPSEFHKYVSYCGHLFPVICLPQDEIGAGYPRYWIQKIALRLELQFIWMIDDSVKCFFEYHPDQKPKKAGSYSKYRKRKFGHVFKRIEKFVKEANKEKPIGAMSPRRFHVQFPSGTPFTCKPPQCAVYLNLTALSEKKVFYRPELKTLEDMIFGFECEQKGLKVYRDNRIMLKDQQWKYTGASSPSVRQQWPSVKQ